MNEDEKMIISKEMDFGKSILGILDVLEDYDIVVNPSNAISLLKNRIFVEELLTKQGKELAGVPSSVRRALVILQSVMNDEKILTMCRTKTLHHLLLPRALSTSRDVYRCSSKDWDKRVHELAISTSPRRYLQIA